MKKRENPNAPWAFCYGREFERGHNIKSIGKVVVFAVIFLIAIGTAWLWQQAETERNKASTARLLAEAQFVRSQAASQYPLSALLAI
ncbi:MAG: hypothetical protein ACREDU_00090 [Methylocella sp.]